MMEGDSNCLSNLEAIALAVVADAFLYLLNSARHAVSCFSRSEIHRTIVARVSDISKGGGDIHKAIMAFNFKLGHGHADCPHVTVSSASSSSSSSYSSGSS